VYVQSNGVNLGLPIPNVWIAEGVSIENAMTGQGDDVLIGNNGSNTLDGGPGIDTVWIESQRDDFTFSKTLTNNYTIVANANPGNQDTLIAIERLKFNDIGLALDLNGHAGQVARLLGAVFGPSAITNQEYVGIGLAEADKGLSYEQLGKFAIIASGLKTPDEVVTLLWTNLFATVPSETEKSPYIEQLVNKEISVGMLAVIAADSDANIGNINWAGLVATGIAFI
jgi:hypothetical protein